MADGDPREYRVTFCVEGGDRKRLEAASRRADRSMSWTCARALRAYLDQQDASSGAGRRP